MLELDSTLFGDYGDTRAWAWWVWAKSRGLIEGAFNPWLAAPFGAPEAGVISQPISEQLVLALAAMGGEIAAINLFVLLAFPLTALSCYELLARLVEDRTAAFLGGLIFGFCPAAVLQAAGGHAVFALNVFLPLFVGALFFNRARRTLLSALAAATAFAAVTFTSIYFGYFALFVAAYFVAFDIATSRRSEFGTLACNYVACAAFAFIVVLPVEFAALHEQLTAGRDSLEKAGHARDFSDLMAFAARPWNYLLPSIDHPVVGSFLESHVRANLHGSNVFEQTLYLGIVPLALLTTGIVVAVRRRFSEGHRSAFLFFALGALCMFFLSLPPVTVGGLPTPSLLLFQVAPMFRAYARFGIVVNFFVACAAAVTLAHLNRSMNRSRYNALFAVAMSLLAFEYWSVSPGHARRIDEPPQVYRWLAEQPADAMVAEYPMVRWDEAASYDYLFWQRIHGKRLVNGASPDNAAAWQFFERVSDPSNPDTATLLKAAGVTYVIVHKTMYGEGPIPGPIKRYYSPGRAALKFDEGVLPSLSEDFRLHEAFGPDLVFTLK